MEANYPGNAKPNKGAATQQEDKPKVEKVVTGKVVQRKKSLGRRITEFVIGDGSRNAVRYVLEDVLYPAAKDTLVDAITQGVERRVFGEAIGHGRTRSAGRGGSSGGGSFVSYNRYSGDPRGQGSSTIRRDEPQRGASMSAHGRRNHDFDEIELTSRAEANEVLERMYDLMDKYQVVSVSELYVMLGVVPDFTDEKWGWETLQGSGIRRTRNGGYVLALPRPEPIA
jgi:hypothetical protein